ncbi:beta-ketoacyl-[acyl-carrier-protein] synthase family protein [Streptomyces sp. CA-210063]|uniref:beta-ketoacyl-[acyl-carrier-protein] synthase family protein n=1 Tax=Streptomyces sp. CA-210063 TaxID=2801029 RepID=UPI00214BDDC6|nr:beta-ketoacyl-[acyl-carrier-protein] synthase family protein [Streptomyces sp. CA-210063]UUU34733.1 beta-ketoacyl-[acyl-carrier-protein] synthase family protein [Streptomyces sp. CA-210063]
MTGDVTVTGFGVRTAFGTGADALRRGVFAGVPSFAPTTRFDTGPYRTPMAGAAPDGPDAVEGWALRHALAQCGTEALAMADLPRGTDAAVLLGIAGDCTSITRYWREAAARPGAERGGGGVADQGAAAAQRPVTNGRREAAPQGPPRDASGGGPGGVVGRLAEVEGLTEAGGFAEAGGLAEPGRVHAPLSDAAARPARAGGLTGPGPGHAFGTDPALAAAAGLADAVPAHLAESLAGGLRLTGPRLTFTNACVASAAAIIHACRLISSGRIDVAVCAGGYLVEEETFGKFDSGRALSRDGMVRPFSADRTGLLLGDGVAAVVLESAEHARRRGARPLASVVGWGAATDAHHIAQPHPEGVGLARAARQALRLAGDPDGAGLGYVNAHGTGTKYNDGAETRGLRAAFPERAESIPVSSTKSTTGHLLEAAGVVEFVITLLALMDGVLPPTAGLTRADPECDLDYVPNKPRQADLRRALTINAAFGGANTALVLERP